MAKIHTLEIKNFRGIKSLKAEFYQKNFICLVGKGDSGKTSVLEAINLVLSSNYKLDFNDTDFFSSDSNAGIVISALLYDVDESLLLENKFGLYKVIIEKDTGKIINDYQNINDCPSCQDPNDEYISALQLKVEIQNDLEPVWYIINDRNTTQTEITRSDRSKFNVFYISDFVDKHFTSSRGSPLYRLLSSFKDNHHHVESLNILRNAKEQIDNSSSQQNVVNTLDAITSKSSELGIALNDLTNTIDFKDLLARTSNISLHDELGPLRLKGKGSKRLVSLAIQHSVAQEDGIILIDEVEQGLESHRIKHLIRTIYATNRGQYFVTTHSNSVIEELASENIFLINSIDSTGTKEIDSKQGNRYQGIMRACPEAIYADKIIMCEGKTEIGFCRALDKYRVNNKMSSMTIKNVVYTYGEGDTFYDRAIKLKELGKNVCVLCDSDVKSDNQKNRKQPLRNEGIKLIDCENDLCIEQQVLKDLPWDAVVELCTQSKLAKCPEYKTAIQDQNTNNLWTLIKSNEPFKTITGGELLGEICLKYFDKNNTERKQLFIMINELNAWIDE